MSLLHYPHRLEFDSEERGTLQWDSKPHKDIDLCDYAKYLLKEGSVTEKRELLLCIKSKLILAQGVIKLES